MREELNHKGTKAQNEMRVCALVPLWLSLCQGWEPPPGIVR